MPDHLISVGSKGAELGELRLELLLDEGPFCTGLL
jgi:hypothetical protein